jgi:hypothetical protein
MAPSGSALNASISAIDNGLFHATYRTDAAVEERRQLPHYQVGASVSDARRKIEETAHLLGFETIIWDKHIGGSAD